MGEGHAAASEASDIVSALEVARAVPGPPALPSNRPDVPMLRSLLLVPLRLIDPHPANVRDDLGDLTELRDSIRRVGLLEPLVGAPRAARFRLIAGHRRFQACKDIGMYAAPLLLRTDLEEDGIVEAMLIENMQRVDLRPLEEAKAMRALIALGRTADAIGKAIGKTGNYVSRRLMLLELPVEVQGRLNAKEISPTDAENLARHIRSNGAVKDRGWDRPHWASSHPLQEAAAALCARNEHGLRRRQAGACGQCWEAVIRQDENEAMLRRGHAGMGQA